MNLEDEFRLLVGAYYGVLEMDEYQSKVYILKEIEDDIRNFVKTYPFSHFDYQREINIIEKLPLKRKLQDSLILLNRINAPLELTLLMRKKLEELENGK